MHRNPEIPYTYRYSQPEEYRFSIDSIEMAWEVSRWIKTSGSTPQNILDLCAGCGVIGFELNFHQPDLKKIDFVEVQEAYQQHFVKNRQQILNPGEFHFLNINYERLLAQDYRQKYDLILCNPPYFRPGFSSLSPSELKNRSRFFLDSTFAQLLKVIQQTLTPEGKAFVLLRSLEDHGVNVLQEAQAILGPHFQLQTIISIRGTSLVLISANY